MPSRGLPPFTAGGKLPPGTFELTLTELRDSYLVKGPAGYPDWDQPWRAKLVDNLAICVEHLRRVGIDHVYIGGSFVEDKFHPNDIDGYFPCDLRKLESGELEQELNALDPGVWTWDPFSRQLDPETNTKQFPMWHRYRVELYPTYPGQQTGFRDRHGRPKDSSRLFRGSRDGALRDMIKIVGK